MGNDVVEGNVDTDQFCGICQGNISAMIVRMVWILLASKKSLVH